MKGENGIGNLASDDHDSDTEEESEYLKAIRTKNSDELKEEFIKKLNEFHDLGREYGNDDEDDEDFSRFRDYYLAQVDVKLSEICRENGYDWNGDELIKKEFDQEFDKLIIIARERAKFNRFNSNREFCRSYNSCKFMVCSDINETGKDFDKFKENLEALAEACEEGNLDWPFEKLYWEHWEILRGNLEEDELKEFMIEYSRRTRIEQYDWHDVYDAEKDVVDAEIKIEWVNEEHSEEFI